MRRLRAFEASCGVGVAAADERAGRPAEAQSGRSAAGCKSRREPTALGVGEPHESCQAEQRGDEEVEPQAEDAVGGIDAEQLFDDAKA